MFNQSRRNEMFLNEFFDSFFPWTMWRSNEGRVCGTGKSFRGNLKFPGPIQPISVNCLNTPKHKTVRTDSQWHWICHLLGPGRIGGQHDVSLSANSCVFCRMCLPLKGKKKNSQHLPLTLFRKNTSVVRFLCEMFNQKEKHLHLYSGFILFQAMLPIRRKTNIECHSSFHLYSEDTT